VSEVDRRTEFIPLEHDCEADRRTEFIPLDNPERPKASDMSSEAGTSPVRAAEPARSRTFRVFDAMILIAGIALVLAIESRPS
jgi:hypothetical protein